MPSSSYNCKRYVCFTGKNFLYGAYHSVLLEKIPRESIIDICQEVVDMLDMNCDPKNNTNESAPESNSSTVDKIIISVDVSLTM